MSASSDEMSFNDSPQTESAASSQGTHSAGVAGVSSVDASASSSAASTSDPSPSAGAQAGTPEKKKPKKWDPLTIPGPEQLQMEDLMNNCFTKGVLSCAMGGVAGLAFGLFSASIENAAPMETGMGDPNVNRDRPTRVVLKEMAKNMKDKSLSYAKGFAYFGALYSFNECVIEKYRAKHDRWNPALAGCATGAMMAYSGGPQAMCLGCASVGAFSLAIEHFLGM